MRGLGRLMQHAGLILPPIGIIAQITEAIRVGHLLMLLVFSVALFYLGRYVEGYSK